MVASQVPIWFPAGGNSGAQCGSTNSTLFLSRIHGKLLRKRRIGIEGSGGMNCHHCGTEIKIERFVGRTDECHMCGSDLHSCLNCANYEPTLSNRCREPNTEWIPHREKAKFFDFFTPNKTGRASARPGASMDDARRAFDSLFKK